MAWNDREIEEHPRRMVCRRCNVPMEKAKTGFSYLTFTFHGTGFLQHMVRILVGTLLEVGFKKRTPESILKLLEEKDRKAAGPTAPACGLCMMKVDYH